MSTAAHHEKGWLIRRLGSTRESHLCARKPHRNSDSGPDGVLRARGHRLSASTNVVDTASESDTDPHNCRELTRSISPASVSASAPARRIGIAGVCHGPPPHRYRSRLNHRGGRPDCGGSSPALGEGFFLAAWVKRRSDYEELFSRWRVVSRTVRSSPGLRKALPTASRPAPTSSSCQPLQPCVLNQIYSLRYCAVPVVSRHRRP